MKSFQATTRDISYMKMARKEMLQSELSIKVGAVIISSGRVLARGRNKFGRRQCMPNDARTIHAEVDVISDLLSRRKSIPKRSRIYIYREANGHPALALPCKDCLQILFSHGIYKVWFTIHKGYACLGTATQHS